MYSSVLIFLCLSVLWSDKYKILIKKGSVSQICFDNFAAAYYVVAFSLKNYQLSLCLFPHKLCSAALPVNWCKSGQMSLKRLAVGQMLEHHGIMMNTKEMFSDFTFVEQAFFIVSRLLTTRQSKTKQD